MPLLLNIIEIEIEIRDCPGKVELMLLENIFNDGRDKNGFSAPRDSV